MKTGTGPDGCCSNRSPPNYRILQQAAAELPVLLASDKDEDLAKFDEAKLLKLPPAFGAQSRITAGNGNAREGERRTRGDASTGSALPLRRRMMARRALVNCSGS